MGGRGWEAVKDKITAGGDKLKGPARQVQAKIGRAVIRRSLVGERPEGGWGPALWAGGGIGHTQDGPDAESQGALRVHAGVQSSEGFL